MSSYGFGFATEVGEAPVGANAVVNFKLKKNYDPTLLSSAELMTTLPQEKDVKWLEARCVGCHGLSQLDNVRGATVPVWHAIFKLKSFKYDNDPTRAELDHGAEIAEKYFGPGTKPPLETAVRRAPLSDEVFKATYYTINLPETGTILPRSKNTLPHSITADNLGGAWVAEAGNAQITRWDMKKGTLQAVELKEKKSGPHTPVIDRHGWVWTSTVVNSELVGIDPKTLKVEYIKMDSHPHTLSIDADGKIWGNGSHVFRFDPDTRGIQYWPAMKSEAHPDAFINRLKLPGSEPSMVAARAYHAVRDSKGIVWYTSLYTGGIVRLDPSTGQQEYINPEHIASSRGTITETTSPASIPDRISSWSTQCQITIRILDSFPSIKTA